MRMEMCSDTDTWCTNTVERGFVKTLTISGGIHGCGFSVVRGEVNRWRIRHEAEAQRGGQTGFYNTQ